MAAVSGYRCPEYDAWYAGWERHDLKVRRSLPGLGTPDRRVESLWLNPAAARAGAGRGRQLALFEPEA